MPVKNYQAGEEKFFRIVLNGRPGTPMAPFKGILSPEEVRSIYLYLTPVRQQ
ncbi:MAG: cytochrome c [Candidatus Rokuibacteriota bacterium]